MTDAEIAEGTSFPRSAPTLHRRPPVVDLLDDAQRALDERPRDPAAHQRVQRSVLLHLDRDAFLAFLAETAHTYVITLRGSRPIVVPKVHTPPELYPPDKRPPAERVFDLTWWALLGLVPAGLGALILSPLIVIRALRLVGQGELSQRDRRVTLLSIALAIGLGFLGLLFAFFLFLHLSP